MGDILLPEGQTVEQLARTALTRGLRGAGFRVLLRGQEGYEQAIPLEADIRRFWAWFSPGLFAPTWSSTREYRSPVRLSPSCAARSTEAMYGWRLRQQQPAHG